MKRMKGFINGVEVTLLVMILGYAGVVGQRIHSGAKAPESPAVHNYVGSYDKGGSNFGR